MVRLTAALISAEQEGADLTHITSLLLAHRHIHQLSGLDVCEKLTRLDLSNNDLSTLEGLSMCKSLKWLSVSGNKLESFLGIESLSNLTVLNGSRNLLTSIYEVTGLVNLRALVVNNNQITTIPRLDRLSNLNTLVLSHNPIRELGKSFTKLLALSKLSLSHCRLQVLGASLKRCITLQELRLAYNQLMGLPKDLERNGQLRILDLGNNYIQAWSELEVLGMLQNLKSLNLKVNPIRVEKNYHESVSSLLPNLEILDGHRVDAVHKKVQKQVGSTKVTDNTKLCKQFHISASEHAKRRLTEQRTDQSLVKKSKTLTAEKDHPADDNNDDDDDDDDDDTKQFMNLITQVKGEKRSSDAQNQEKNGQTNSFSRRNSVSDSGVVSVLDAKKKFSSFVKKAGNALLGNYLGSEIGRGGPSTWETQISSISSAHTNSFADEHRKQSRISSTNPSSYSRWKLKTSHPS